MLRAAARLAVPKVFHIKYFSGFHEREIFPAHQELVIPVNNPDSSLTGSSGTIAWELEGQNVHFIVMWSVPYNLNIYNSYFAIGVVRIRTKFTRDMLPFWYEKMLDKGLDRHFQRGKAGSHLVFRHTDIFILGSLEKGYHPVLNLT